MSRVLFRQPGLFAQLKRQNGGLMAAHHRSAISHEHINGSKRGQQVSVTADRLVGKQHISLEPA